MASNSFQEKTTGKPQFVISATAQAVFLEGPPSQQILYVAEKTTGVSAMRAVYLYAPSIADSVGVPVFLGTPANPNKFGSFVMPVTGTVGEAITIQLSPGTRELDADDVLMLSVGNGRRFAGAAAFQVLLTIY